MNAGVWNIVRGIPADWFGQWQDRVLWDGMKTLTANDGTFEPQLMQQWLKEHEPDYADDLLATLAGYASRIRRSNIVLRAVSVQRCAGERRMVNRWAEAIIELFNPAAPIKEICDLAKQTPLMEGGVAECSLILAGSKSLARIIHVGWDKIAHVLMGQRIPKNGSFAECGAHIVRISDRRPTNHWVCSPPLPSA